MNLALAKALVESLPVGIPGVFNPWRETCECDTERNTQEAKLERLACHLDCVPELILVGEAPGYQGCRYSGIAFTSERLVLEGVIPRVGTPEGRLCTRRLPFSEPSATVVWSTLKELGIEKEVILWNAVQLHPHHAGDPWSNRRPSQAELDWGKPGMRLLRDTFEHARIVTVGQTAAGLLRNMGIPVEAAVRHPAFGGATEFRAGMRDLLGK